MNGFSLNVHLLKKRKRKFHRYTPQWNVLRILIATIHAKPYNQRTQCHLWCAGHFILMHSAETFIHSPIVYSKNGGSRILCIICTLLQTLPGLKNSYIQKGTVQVEFCKNQNWANIWSSIDIYTWESYWNPNSNMLEPHWPQHDSPIICVNAQQFSPTASTHSAFTPHIDKIHIFKKCLISTITFQTALKV